MFGIAILGFGNIGSGLADFIDRNRGPIEKALGDELSIRYVLDRRDLSATPYAACVVSDIATVINDPSVNVVCEMLGGLSPAYEYSLAALRAGKSVVTSNKEVVARYGAILLETAKANDAFYLYEASVGSAIPVLHAFRHALAGTSIHRIDGILNGTTNYVLTRMRDCATPPENALREAQKLGYAEPDPTADITGMDSCRKICILAATAWGEMPRVEDVYCEGISQLNLSDDVFALRCGGVLRLVATAVRSGERMLVAVSPCILLGENPLRVASDVFNAVRVGAGDTGDLMFYGPGAGRYPTAGALVSDLLDIACRRGDSRAWHDTTCPLIRYFDAPLDWCVEAELSREMIEERLNDYVILYEENGVIGLLCLNISQKELAGRLDNCHITHWIRAMR